jgi:hypothetical protein
MKKLNQTEEFKRDEEEGHIMVLCCLGMLVTIILSIL